MKIVGIVAEYNPFHNGHAYQVRAVREATGCDCVIACMAGHFTQRGEPAVLSKWDRARMALSCGVDAVFELPALFAVRPADAFARGGVGILGGLGVDAISFGCETADLALIGRLADLREQEPEGFSAMVRRRLEDGVAHARAWGEAAGDWLGLPAETVNQPNLMLAVEYLRVMRRCYPAVEAVPIERIGGYHDLRPGFYASASAIRTAFAAGDEESALASIPGEARHWAKPDALHSMDDLLLYKLRGMSLEELRRLPDINEGLEYRLYRLCREAGSREALLEALKCKRYTRARLSRMLLHALLDLSREDLEGVRNPPYARLIGIREGARPLLRELKARAELPIVSDVTKLKEDACFRIECRATDLWSLLHDAASLRRQGREFTEAFVKTDD